jgi:hypothetical protein
MRISIAAGEPSNLLIMVGDISSAYLDAFTLEKLVLLLVLNLDRLLDTF